MGFQESQEKFISRCSESKSTTKDFVDWIVYNQDDLYDIYTKFIRDERLFYDLCKHAYYNRICGCLFSPSECVLYQNSKMIKKMQLYAFDNDFDFFETMDIPPGLSKEYINFLYTELIQL